MKYSSSIAALAATVLPWAVASPTTDQTASSLGKKDRFGKPDFVKRTDADVIAPKMMIVSMFDPEADVWYGIPEFDVLAQNISLPGLSPLFPEVHCTADGDICQITIGESEINAASSVMALVLAPQFNLTKTYFMVAGIAGINPEVASICSVTFAKYAVQVALQYEFDIRELPDNYTTGYIPLGTKDPSSYPKNIYGTEVYELNQGLQEYAYEVASKVTLNDSAAAIAYRANYASEEIYTLGAAPPGVYKCDVATSDVYYSGRLLGEAFGNTTKLLTNGSGVYCSAAQEDNATLEVLVRAAAVGLVDYSRALVMRTASDFDRQYSGESAEFNLLYASQGGFLPSLRNIYLAGLPIIQGILSEWESVFDAGIPAPNYIGDIFGTLGGTPDFGPADYDNTPSKRDVQKPESRMEMMRRRGPKAGPAVTE